MGRFNCGGGTGLVGGGAGGRRTEQPSGGGVAGEGWDDPDEIPLDEPPGNPATEDGPEADAGPGQEERATMADPDEASSEASPEVPEEDGGISNDHSRNSFGSRRGTARE